MDGKWSTQHLKIYFFERMAKRLQKTHQLQNNTNVKKIAEGWKTTQTSYKTTQMWINRTSQALWCICFWMYIYELMPSLCGHFSCYKKHSLWDLCCIICWHGWKVLHPTFESFFFWKNGRKITKKTHQLQNNTNVKRIIKKWKTT